MKIIDTHAHLDFDEFDKDRKELLQKLKKEGIGVINPSSSMESNQAVDEISKENALVWGALGIHPTELRVDIESNIAELFSDWRARMDKNKKLVAFGEVGLDYFRHKDSALLQKTFLREVLTLAKDMKKPIIFHCRQAYGDLLTLLSDYQPVKGVIHCFSGDIKEAKQSIELGLMISFTCNVTYKDNAHLRKIMAETDLSKILVETDSPFLPPQSKRGERNDPSNVIEVSEVIAEERGLLLSEVVSQTTENARALFGLG